jgi:hypothetical protein
MVGTSYLSAAVVGTSYSSAAKVQIQYSYEHNFR